MAGGQPRRGRRVGRETEPPDPLPFEGPAADGILVSEKGVFAVPLKSPRVGMDRRLPPAPLIIGGFVVALLTATAWWLRIPLHRFASAHAAVLPALAAGTAVIGVSLVTMVWAEISTLQRKWRQRTERAAGLPALVPLPIWQEWLRKIPDPLEWLGGPILRTPAGRRMALDWAEAGFGERASRYLVLLGVSSTLGSVLGFRIGGLVLGLSLAILLPLLPRAMVRGRAETGRRQFGEQLPAALDALAAGLSAGLSFRGALDFANPELPEPVAGEFRRLSRRLSLGHPLETALRDLHSRREDEGLALVVEGIVLQRRFGGDMVQMLNRLADLLRERVELEREVRAVSTQGKLSGYIIGGLVPVSAGLLLALNPRYVDVLFDTIIGQALVVIALLLQLAGWVIISRMIRFRY
jgi:tight adherence protein B